MNTLNYIGSKHTLCPIIIDIILKEISDLKSKSFMDLFAGTGSIGFRFQGLVDSCNANDLEYLKTIQLTMNVNVCFSVTKMRKNVTQYAYI